MLPSCPTFTKSVTVSVPVSKMGVVFHQVWSESQWTVLLRYLINTLLSQQMLDAIKHVVDNIIVFQQDSAPVCSLTSRGSITLGCADILSANQHDIVMFMRRWCDYLPCSSCDEANGWNFGSWTLTVVIWSVTLYSIVKIIPWTVPCLTDNT